MSATRCTHPERNAPAGVRTRRRGPRAGAVQWRCGKSFSCRGTCATREKFFFESLKSRSCYKLTHGKERACFRSKSRPGTQNQYSESVDYVVSSGERIVDLTNSAAKQRSKFPSIGYCRFGAGRNRTRGIYGLLTMDLWKECSTTHSWLVTTTPAPIPGRPRSNKHDQRDTLTLPDQAGD